MMRDVNVRCLAVVDGYLGWTRSACQTYCRPCSCTCPGLHSVTWVNQQFLAHRYRGGSTVLGPATSNAEAVIITYSIWQAR